MKQIVVFYMNTNELTTQEKIKLAVDIYNKYASIYSNHVHGKLFQFQLSKFVSLLPSKARVLDIGCSSGRDTLYLKEDNFDVIPIEISDSMIEEAKKNGVNPLKIDIRNPEGLTGNFDGIWCMATFSDIPKEESSKVLININNLLKPEGILYIAVKEGASEVIINKDRYENAPKFYALYKKDELENLLKMNGFNIIEAIVSDDEGVRWVEIFVSKKL